MFDWNDLRYFLAVARHGSTIAAAKALISASRRFTGGLPNWKNASDEIS